LWSDGDAGDDDCENDDGSGDDCLRGFQMEERLMLRQKSWKRELQIRDKKDLRP
jgi:hypothetical protein